MSSSYVVLFISNFKKYGYLNFDFDVLEKINLKCKLVELKCWMFA